MRDRLHVLAAMTAVLWLGFVLAISFMEAPLKFRAPQAPYLAVLSVGRIVFHALVRVELALLFALALMSWLGTWPTRARVWLWVLAALVLLQQLWLFPQLDRRMVTQLAGGTVPPDLYGHTLYIALECVKVVVLPTLSWSLVRRLTHTPLGIRT